MIIVRISGGLGNQLFQYALGRTLALHANSELKLDTHLFDLGVEKRKFVLDQFSLVVQRATAEDCESIDIPTLLKEDFFSKLAKKMYRFSERNLSLHEKKIILEPSFAFCRDILEISGSAYLSGNWQSEKYFAEIQDVLRKDITLKHPLSPAAEIFAQRIHAPEANAVSLHIRRGDYVQNPKTFALHGICPPAYYENAVEILSEKIPRPVFFIFSDDIAWAKKNVRIDFPTFFVSDKNIPDYEELILMSRCRHHIIANSSFSWWGAWLNPSKEKIVIAPRQWFARGDIDTKDVIPDSWVKI